MPNNGVGGIVDILLTQDLINQDQVNELKKEEISTGKTITQLIEEKQLVSELDYAKALSELNKIPFINVATVSSSPEALNLIQESVARKYSLLPFASDKEKKILQVAMKDPLDLTVVNFIEQKTGFKVEAHYALGSEVERMIAERYSQNLSTEVTQAIQENTEIKQQVQQNLTDVSGGVVRDAPINRIVETILDFAMKSRASDVHIEPQTGRTRVRFRIDGILVEKLVLPKSVHEAVVSRVKILSKMKIDEKRLPQDGRFAYAHQNKEVDLRVSCLPTVEGEKIVMRLLKKNMAIPSLEDLGLSGLALTNVKQAIKIPRGIILVTGPTGSGKTTTLYSILNIINQPLVNIITLEDPVEYQVPGVSQVQVHTKAGLTFASGLRSFLRQDPDVIMVGEIRDNETADLAVQASLTGHLVFSTLHTNSAAGAIPRLLDMEVEPFLLTSSLTLIIAQRVVRRINPEYKEEYKPEPAVVENIKQVLGPFLPAWCKKNNKDPNDLTLYRPKKDRPQTESDYVDRVGIFEVINITEDIGKLIAERKPAVEIERVARGKGTLLMKQDGYLKALAGVTTIEEVLRVAEE
jgi:type IV pilus assembly protein PilB